MYRPIYIRCTLHISVANAEIAVLNFTSLILRSNKRTFQLLMFDLLVDLGNEALYTVVFAVGNEVGEVDWLLTMRLRSRNQPQSTHKPTGRRQ